MIKFRTCIGACAATLMAAVGLTQAQTVVPASFAHPSSDIDTTQPGFRVRIHQANNDGGEQPNTLARTEEELAGFLIDPVTHLPFANNADFSNVTLNADGTYSETVAIDYGGSGSLTFPGIPGQDLSVSSIAMEVTTFLDLPVGTYNMIVNSDDGFRVTVGNPAGDRFSAITLGAYDGGRGAGDSQFAFTITQAGAYSFRLIWEQGGGGYNCSWYVANSSVADAHVLVNADSPDAVKAYQKLKTVAGPFVDYLSPGPDQTGVSPGVVVKARIKDGDGNNVNQASVKMYFDGTLIVPIATHDASGTLVTFDPPGLLGVLSKHKVTLVYADSTVPANVSSNSFSFTVANFGNLTLPAPIVYEDFEATDEGALPAGWTVENYTTGATGDYDLDNPNSDAYLDWVLITTDRVLSIGAAGRWDGNLRLAFPDQFVNGVEISGIASNKFLYAESDQRGGSQVQYVYSKDYDMTGHDHLFVSYYSMYEQNQDSIGSAEYSIDQGATWLPIVYMLDKDDIKYQADGTTIDGYATMAASNPDTAVLDVPPYDLTDDAGNPIRYYGAFIGVKSNLWSTLSPFISGRINDDGIESKRVELFPIPQADNQQTVRFRFAQGGTGSWFFGIDNLGIYSITAPIVVAPKITDITANQVLVAGQALNLTVTATGTAPLTYQWSKDTVDIDGATSSTFSIGSVKTTDAGTYTVVVRNAKGADTKAISVTVIGGDADLKSDLVVHLAFDGNYADTSGHANNATAVGSPDFQAGKLGQALHVKSTSDGTVANYATLGYPADLKLGASADFTVSLWVKIAAQTDDHPFISNKDWGSSNNRGWGVFSQSGGAVRFNITGTGGTKFSVTPAGVNVKDGGWHNVVMSVARAGNVTTFVDGSLINTTAQLTTGTIDTDDLNFKVNIGQDGTGTYTDGGSSSLDALIDDVAIWKRALGANDAGAIYIRGSQGIDAGTDPIQVGMVAHLGFEDNYLDTSGRGNNAAAAGTPDFQAGKIGKALHVKTTADGTIENYATLGYPDDLKFGDSTDFTTSLWVKIATQADDHPFISNKDWGSSNNRGWGVFSQSGGAVRLNITGTGGTKFSVTPPGVNVKDGGWHHVVMAVKRTGNVDFYVDGAKINSTAIATTGSIDTDDLGYAVNVGQDGRGTYTDGGSSSLDALIDDVVIWRRSITLDEVGKIFLRGNSGLDVVGNASVTIGSPTIHASISGNTFTVTWSGGGSFQLQRKTDIGPGAWTNVGSPSSSGSATDTVAGGAAYYRLQAQ